MFLNEDASNFHGALFSLDQLADRGLMDVREIEFHVTMPRPRVNISRRRADERYVSPVTVRKTTRAKGESSSAKSIGLRKSKTRQNRSHLARSRRPSWPIVGFLRFDRAINAAPRIRSRPSARAYYRRVSAARPSSRRHSSGRAAGYYPPCNPLCSFFFIESNEPPRHVVINTLES